MLSKSFLTMCHCKCICFFLYLGHEAGTGRKNLTEAPIAGNVNFCPIASADRSILYWLYLSKRRSRLSPDGFNFSLGIRNSILSPTVLLICVCGVIFSIIFLLVEDNAVCFAFMSLLELCKPLTANIYLFVD